MKIPSNQIYISGINENAKTIAKSYGFGIEHTYFSYSKRMDDGEKIYDTKIKELSGECTNFCFHAPFYELTMGAVDEKVKALSMDRFNQFINIVKKYNPKKLIFHTGFLPNVYYKEWFIPNAITFLKDFLKDKDENIDICIENVFSDSPDFIYDIVREVNKVSKKQVSVCLDIGHINAYAHDTTIYEWIDKCKDYISHFHIHNNDTKKDTHSDFDDGNIDIPKVVDYAIQYIKTPSFTIEACEAEKLVDFFKKMC